MRTPVKSPEPTWRPQGAPQPTSYINGTAFVSCTEDIYLIHLLLLTERHFNHTHKCDGGYKWR